MIVRDEAKHLERCLQAALPWVDEVCVVDTGSTDETIEIATRYGARVQTFEWTDDFSAARNASIEMADLDWILVLNADEFLVAGSGPALRRAILDPDAMCRLIYQNSEDETGRVHPLAIPRLFRKHPEIRFSRPVHESIQDSLIALGHGDSETCEVRVRNVGYLPGEQAGKDKNERNIAILRNHVTSDPANVTSWFKLAVSLKRPDQAEEREACFESAFGLIASMPRAERMDFSFLPQLYDGYAAILVQTGDLTTALRVVARGLADLPNAVDLIWRRGDIAWRVGDVESAERYLKACFRPRSVDARFTGGMAARTVKPAVRLAEVAMERGEFAEAQRYVDRALSFEPTHRPAQVLAVRAALLLGDVNGATLGLAELLEEAPECTSVRLLGGELAWLQGDIVGADALWDGLDSSTDQGNEALCRKAIAAVASGRLTDARAILPNLVDRDISAAAARLMVSVVCGRAWGRGNAFRSERLMQSLIGWLRELMCAEADDALTLFATNSVHYAADLPGIEMLLTHEESAAEAGA